MAENEILPKLDLLMSTYVAGLAGSGDVAHSYVNQFSQGRPSYTAGLTFDVPLGRRAGRANLERRELEVRKACMEFQATVEASLTEVELAVREVQTTAREVVTRYHTMVAVDTETAYLEERWIALPGADRSAARLLEDLLDSQERLAVTEDEFVTAQISYVLATTRVRHAMGTLLEAADEVAPSSVQHPVREYEDGDMTRSGETSLPPAPSRSPNGGDGSIATGATTAGAAAQSKGVAAKTASQAKSVSSGNQSSDSRAASPSPASSSSASSGDSIWNRLFKR
jgi:hypothetical protein